MDIIFVIGIIAAACIFFFIGKMQKGNIKVWEDKVKELSENVAAKETTIQRQTEQIKTLTAATANSINSIENPPSGVTGYIVNNTEDGKWNKMCMIFNGGDDEQNVSVDGEWHSNCVARSFGMVQFHSN